MTYLLAYAKPKQKSSAFALRPTFRLKYWCRKRSVVVERNEYLMLNYVFLDSRHVGEANLVRRDGSPVVVPDDVVEDTMRKALFGLYDVDNSRESKLATGILVGDEIVMPEGLLEGCKAVVTSVKKNTITLDCNGLVLKLPPNYFGALL